MTAADSGEARAPRCGFEPAINANIALTRARGGDLQAIRSIVDKLTAEIAGKDADARYAVLVEKDVEVPMRDGVRLKADIFRPQHSGEFHSAGNDTDPICR